MNPIYTFSSKFFQSTTLFSVSALGTLSLSGATESTHSHAEVHDLDPYVVNATLAPRSSRDMLNPATVVTGDLLDERLAATIGQVLDGQPGVHSTAFGAGASRPVIRGLEGNRLRVMESGVESGDLSGDSPDHAVAIEPFFVERIEVLRGASTLLYGSSAIGGVVNVLDRRIPRGYPDAKATLEAMVDYNSAAEGWTYAGLMEVPFDQFVVSASYLDRDHGDYSIPGFAEKEHAEEHEHEEEEHDEVSGTLENAFVENQVGSLALSWWASEQTRVSIAWTTTDSLYGVPGHMHGEHEEHEGEEEEHEEDEDHEHEESVYIDMAQSTVDLEFEHEMKDSWLKSVEGRLRIVDYEHQEMEGEEIGTDFDRSSWEARLSGTYLSGNQAPGAFGTQLYALDSKAVGEESLTPESETMDASVFWLQEWYFDEFRIEGGARAEHREIDAAGTDGYTKWAFSGSLGAKYQINETWSLGTLFNHAERHPVATELYAYGPHAATGQFEIGDPGLGSESANGIDLAIHYTTPIVSASLTAFYTDFSDYIYGDPTGEEIDELPVYQFTHVDAVFRGFESELTWHAWHGTDSFLDVGLLADWLDTEIKDSSNNLPRIPPARIGLDVRYGRDQWTLRSTLRRSFSQEDTAPFEEASAAYTNWSASLLLDLPVTKGQWHLVISGENLLDEEIRAHTSPIKDVAPAPGRHVRVNLAVTF